MISLVFKKTVFFKHEQIKIHFILRNQTILDDTIDNSTRTTTLTVPYINPNRYVFFVKFRDDIFGVQSLLPISI